MTEFLQVEGSNGRPPLKIHLALADPQEAAPRTRTLCGLVIRNSFPPGGAGHPQCGNCRKAREVYEELVRSGKLGRVKRTNRPRGIEKTECSETDLAWIAGFMDGEGCITIRKLPSLAYQLVIVVANTDRTALEKIEAVFGVGKIFVLRRSGPNSNYKTAWQYHIAALQAKSVLEKIYPYLLVKKRDAGIALAFAEIEAGNDAALLQQREELFLKIREGRSRDRKRQHDKTYGSADRLDHIRHSSSL